MEVGAVVPAVLRTGQDLGPDRRPVEPARRPRARRGAAPLPRPRGSLDGIASNLLTDRLRRLESGGVVERRIGASGAVVYALTPWGAELREPIEALVRWSGPLMATGPRADDAFDPRWLAIALPALLGGARSRHPIDIGVEVRDVLLAATVDRDGAQVAVDPELRPASGRRR
ncbi:MAG: winged helix-turn-helix transcriptional regulator [Microthrixaceae bacterium]